MGVDEFGRARAASRRGRFKESPTDDEALRQIFKEIEDRLVAAQGEAIFAGLMVGSLIPALVAKCTLGRDETERLIDTAMLVLEHNRGPTNAGAQRVIDHTRSRLETQMAVLKATPP
jgi:hypothetical protein